MISIKKSLFGKFEDKEVYKFQLKNKNNFQVNILNFGGIITEIYTKDKKGELRNIVLGYKEFEKYIGNPSYAGMFIGRTAGRIENGEFQIDGKIYKLFKNDNKNSLHGGEKGLNTKIYDVNILENGIELNYLSPHLEEGYPGNLNIKITYLIEEEDSFVIKYEAISDEKTYINFTNHSYFNLSGDLMINGDEQILKIDSDKICELGENLIPTGKLLNILEEDNKIFNFQDEKVIKDGIEKGHKQFLITRAYDHPYVLNKKGKNPQIELKSLESGIKMEVFTTENTVVIYTGNYLDEVESFNNLFNDKKVKNNKRFLGITVETQDYPNGINNKFKGKILDKNEKYESKTMYKFSIIED